MFLQLIFKLYYGDKCVDVSTVRCWVKRFKDGEVGKSDFNDKPQSGRPVTASDQFHQDILEERICNMLFLKVFLKKEPPVWCRGPQWKQRIVPTQPTRHVVRGN
uniref:Mos1 transposase HTH domain-containing protein n=1 Tax=Arion vulgaris TaxID=1028688 RepID=A0A0B7ASE1_9EUPU